MRFLNYIATICNNAKLLFFFIITKTLDEFYKEFNGIKIRKVKINLHPYFVPFSFLLCVLVLFDFKKIDYIQIMCLYRTCDPSKGEEP